MKYDEQKYNKVIEICELKQYLKEIEGGDMAEIGEKGITLSGSQKARLSLARPEQYIKITIFFS